MLLLFGALCAAACSFFVVHVFSVVFSFNVASPVVSSTAFAVAFGPPTSPTLAIVDFPECQ